MRIPETLRGRVNGLVALVAEVLGRSDGGADRVKSRAASNRGFWRGGGRAWGLPVRAMVAASGALVLFAGVGVVPSEPVDTAAAYGGNGRSVRPNGSQANGFQSEFDIRRRNLTATAECRYFILKPGFRIELRGPGERAVIEVLNETRVVNGITTRVVVERAYEGRELVEVSRNFFAADRETCDVFYFGEEVDIFNPDGTVTHEGAWLAVPPNRPGLIMPGRPRTGMKFYNEWAPGIAQDRSEVLSTNERVNTRAGRFNDCVLVEESSPLFPEVGEKTFCPGVGMTVDGDLRLWSYGYGRGRERDDD